MRKGMKTVTILLLALVLVLSTPLQAAAASGDSLLPSGIAKENIGPELEAFAAAHADTMAGMAVSVFDRAGILYQNYFGHGDIARGLKVNPDTVFEWGSATKLLVWVSVMQLAEQGKLDLDGDIRQYLPDGFLKNLRFDTPVTMLNLMNHDAGFEETLVGMFTHREDRILSLEDYLTQVQPHQVFAPGEVTAYSNWGVALAGFIVERTGGMPFYQYVHENIFVPLGMEHSALNADLSDNPWVKQQRERLECYTSDSSLMPKSMVYFSMYPAGSCTSTLEDFTAFGRALLDRESPLFRDPSTYDAFLEPTSYFGDTEIPLNHHGMWAIQMYATPVIGHGGNTAGCSSYLRLDVENGVGMVVMTNQANELIFNGQMPELVFGKYEGENLEFTGFAMNARTIYGGPLKLQKLLNIVRITPENTAGAVSVLSRGEGMQKITIPYGDYLVLSLPELICQLLPLVLWVLALLYCLIRLIALGIGWIVRKIRRRMPRKKVRKWTVAACFAQLLPLIPPVFAYLSLLNWKQWPLWGYDLAFGSFLIWAVLYAGQIFWGIRDMVRRRRAQFGSVAVIVSLMISFANILYWELGAFWRL
ncbi:MAG: beta-lactamase family protein [Oscillospiraceae bacterium]|nr:beta-lactamase family protein [Oscillospiraceae bacterium]